MAFAPGLCSLGTNQCLLSRQLKPDRVQRDGWEEVLLCLFRCTYEIIQKLLMRGVMSGVILMLGSTSTASKMARQSRMETTDNMVPTKSWVNRHTSIPSPLLFLAAAAAEGLPLV